jgi:hypothetical protein
MANAIKKISVQRGYDVTKYALASFGGAGGQHACLVADALGMKTVISASLRGRPVGLRHGPRRYPRDAGGAVRRGPRSSRTGGTETVRARRRRPRRSRGPGHPPIRIRIETRAHLRYAGSHQALAVPFGPADALRESFEAEHRSRFGFVSAGRDSFSTCWRWRPSAQRTRGAPGAPSTGTPATRRHVLISTAAARRYRPRSTPRRPAPGHPDRRPGHRQRGHGHHR